MAQQQSGQPNANGSNGKFNWTKLIITMILLAGIVMLVLYFLGVFQKHENIMSWKDFYARTNIGSGKSGLGWKIAKITTNASEHYIKVNFKDHGSYVITAEPALIGNLSLYLNAWISNNGSIPTSTNVGVFEIFKGWNKSFVPVLDFDFSASTPPKAGFPWMSFIFSTLPFILLIGISLLMFKRQSGGAMGDMFGGKTPAKRVNSKKRFSDVAGQEEVKEEVREVVDFLKRPSKYKAAGARIPKGILLGGPPGTGKTLIAKAVAGEASVPFYFISASNFVEMFAGLGAKRVRSMFAEARKSAPAILFIDELDAIGRKRGSSLSGNDEREQTLNQILVEMDGMDENSGMLIIAATNRTDVLDPALTRPGRFDRTITVGLPDVKEREMILELHAKGKRISKDVDFKLIAKRTSRASGAQLENVINEAALLSVRENVEVIEMQHIDEAIDRVWAGPAKKHRVITEKENRMVAVHEAGHAVIGLKVQDADVVQKITIIPRGDAGGYTLFTPKEETYNYKKSQLEAMIMSALGGRAAEQVIYGIGEVSTGAHNDIEKATNIARAMVTQYGMSDLGPIAYERITGNQFLGGEKQKDYSETLAARIDEAIRKIISNAEFKAIETIKKNKKLLGLIVDELLEKETIVYEEIEYIDKKLKRPPKKKVQTKKIEKTSLKDIISKVENNHKKDKK